MGKTDVWILIQHYDQSYDTDIESSLRLVTLSSSLTFGELKSIVYSWADIKENNSKIIKLRKFDNSLIPLSALLQGSSKDEPFIVEVVRVHQFCPVNKRTLPPGYIAALKLKLMDLEKRVEMVENTAPHIDSIRVKAVEETTNYLSNCVQYLDRRLDELIPQDWKAKIELST